MTKTDGTVIGDGVSLVPFVGTVRTIKIHNTSIVERTVHCHGVTVTCTIVVNKPTAVGKTRSRGKNVTKSQGIRLRVGVEHQSTTVLNGGELVGTLTIRFNSKVATVVSEIFRAANVHRSCSGDINMAIVREVIVVVGQVKIHISVTGHCPGTIIGKCSCVVEVQISSTGDSDITTIVVCNGINFNGSARLRVNDQITVDFKVHTRGHGGSVCEFKSSSCFDDIGISITLRITRRCNSRGCPRDCGGHSHYNLCNSREG